MANYWYEKHNCITTYIYKDVDLGSSQVTTSAISASPLYSGYSFNTATGAYSGTGYLGTKDPCTLAVGTKCYDFYSGRPANYIRTYYVVSKSYPNTTLQRGGRQGQVQSTNYSMGSLINNLIAEDGTYPSNGRHTDGFWYVKKGLAGPAAPSNLSGTLVR